MKEVKIMSAFLTGGVYYNDWHTWQSDDDRQGVSLFASAERLYSYYEQKVLPKKEKQIYRG